MVVGGQAVPCVGVCMAWCMGEWVAAWVMVMWVMCWGVFKSIPGSIALHSWIMLISNVYIVIVIVSDHLSCYSV